MTTFASLGIAAPIQTALAEYGYETPTVIQEKAIPAGIAGRDVLGSAQTGTGKTCAFGVPILQRLAAQGHGKPIRALILTPTRELAIQIDDNLHAYGKHLPLTEAVIFGGVGQAPQVEKLKRGVDILTATPGRLLDLAGQGLLDLSQVEIFVLDEADRMLDMGFIHDVRKVIKLLPEKKQTMFFSATLPPEILDLLAELNRRKPVWVELGLQTIHPESAAYLRRGYELPVFEEAVRALRARGIEVIVHLILGIPGETREDMIASARYAGQWADGVKLHLLHVLDGTDLVAEYAAGRVRPLEREEYFGLLEDCLRVLPSSVVIHRLTGDGDKRRLLAPLWSADKKAVLNAMRHRFEEDDLVQGSALGKEA